MPDGTVITFGGGHGYRDARYIPRMQARPSRTNLIHFGVMAAVLVGALGVAAVAAGRPVGTAPTSAAQESGDDDSKRGGWKRVGEGHPGWSQEKADRHARKQAEKEARRAEKRADKRADGRDERSSRKSEKQRRNADPSASPSP